MIGTFPLNKSRHRPSPNLNNCSFLCLFAEKFEKFLLVTSNRPASVDGAISLSPVLLFAWNRSGGKQRKQKRRAASPKASVSVR